MWRTFLRWLLQAAGWPVALLILFEEWGWDPLQDALVRLSARLHLRWLEPRIRALPPYAALALLAVPALLLLPVKLAALWLIAAGDPVLGALVIVGAKVLGTALVAHLFTLTQPALMRLAWFARLHRRWIRWKGALLDDVRASWPWRRGRIARWRWQRRLAALRRG